MTEAIKCKLAVVQMDCVLGEIAPNLEKIARFAEAAGALGVELLVFPETATTGYFLADALERLAEPSDGPTDTALGRIAASAGLHMAVGTIEKGEAGYHDTQVLFAPDGRRLSTYRKAHLFSAERDTFVAGDTPTVVDTSLGALGMTVCYDMIFADYFRRLRDLGAGIVLNSTNWIGDQYQQEVWGWSGVTTQGMAATRALEHGVIVAMANRVGREIGFDSLGHSCIAGPSGRILASLPAGEGLAVADIDLAAEDLERWRAIATYRSDRRPELYSER